MPRFSLFPAVLVLSGLLAACGSGETRTNASGEGGSGLPPADADWNPAGEDLLFMSLRGQSADVYLRRGGDTTWVNLTRAESNDNWPEWSPDRSRIAFHSDRNGRLDVFVMSPEGGDLVRVTDNDDHDYLPSWLPDGRLLFTSWRRESGDSVRAQHVYVTNADGTGQERLPLAGGAPVVGATSAPDGSKLVYGRTDPDNERADLWLASMDDLVGRQITDGEAYYGAPSFSPDGRFLAYYASTENRSDILVQELESGRVDTVLTGGKHYYPRWSPDGSWMLSCSEVAHGDYDILAFPVDGSAEPVTLVSGSTRDCEGRWGPSVRPARVVAP